MDFELTHDLKALQAKARRFTEEELIPREMEVEERETLSEETSRKIRRRAIAEGLWPMNVPKAMGGLGSTVLEQVLAQEQAGRATNDLWGYVGGPYNALLHGNESQRRKYLEPALRGEIGSAAAYAITEPSAGSDTSNLRTTAVKKGARWVINGEKWFVTSGEKAPVIIVHTVTGPDEHTLFLVDQGTPGMRIKRIPKFMTRTEDRHPEMVFESCEVPESQMLGRRGEANEVTKGWFREERLHIAARCLGAAQRLLEEAKRWTAEREAFGKKLYEHQAIGWMLADSATELYAARLMTYKTAWEEDTGRRDVKELHAKTSMCKLYASEMANRVADRAVQIFGGRGVCRDYAAERLFRHLRIDRIWEGTSEIQRAIILNGVMKRDLDRLVS
ncbi:MAG TPA: acyl-CoA dehydrogenase [Candidatus Polarisedimenticolia bacterium]|nr:acyl-CoA dehydrogenase [Candidatus Polarisedimenticolia bacterium]